MEKIYSKITAKFRQIIHNPDNRPYVPERPCSPQKEETENPAEKFEDILKGINNAARPETKNLKLASYEKAQELFKVYTGQDLMQKAEVAERKK